MTALDFVLDRPMPQDPDAERATLGSLLTEPDALPRVRDILQPEDFCNDAHKIIYGTILELDADGQPADLLLVKDRLRSRGDLERVGGPAYLSSLVDGIPDIANVETYAGVVKNKAQLRTLIAEGNRMVRSALDRDADPDEITAGTSERLRLIRPADISADVLDAEAIARRVEELYHAGGVRKGFSTGWPSLDLNYTVARGAWNLVTGIPSHGKSGFLDHLAVNLAKLHDWQIVMFSAENYPAESHVATLIEKYLGAPFNEGPTARMSIENVRTGRAFIERHFRFIDPAAERMTVDRVLSIASALSQERPVDVLIIDPWNELHHNRAKEFSETEYISDHLTKIRRWARAHDAAVYLVAHPMKMQKNAAGSYDTPTPYDVSGSAHWRNKADYCLTIYRDLATDDANVAIHVQKVRRREMGRLGQVVLKYDRVTGRYLDPTAPRLSPWEVA